MLSVRLQFSLVQIPRFLTLCLTTNAVAAQNFEYKMSNIPDKPLYVLSDLLNSHLTHTFAVENRCLATSLCSQELSAHIGISHCRTTLVARARCRSISSVKLWCVHPFFRGVLLNCGSMVLARTSLPQTCTLLRIVTWEM